MKNRLSHQGLRKVDDFNAKDLKEKFEIEIASKNGLATKGYFIGKTLLGKLLLENEEAAGILISFGLSGTSEKSGQIQLIVEFASGIEADDTPNVISYLDKYATTDVPDEDGTDGLTPMIKPNPPRE